MRQIGYFFRVLKLYIPGRSQGVRLHNTSIMKINQQLENYAHWQINSDPSKHLVDETTNAIAFLDQKLLASLRYCKGCSLSQRTPNSGMECQEKSEKICLTFAQNSVLEKCIIPYNNISWQRVRALFRRFQGVRSHNVGVRSHNAMILL